MPPPPPPSNIVPVKKEKKIEVAVEEPKQELSAWELAQLSSVSAMVPGGLDGVKGIPEGAKVIAKKPTKQYIYVREAIGQFDVYQALRLPPSIFKELFGVEYPDNNKYFEGQQISQVVFEDFQLNLIWGRDLSQSNNSFGAKFAMTNSTFALWQLLCNNGFVLKDSRNYNTYIDKESRFNGRKLCERVFERDLSN